METNVVLSRKMGGFEITQRTTDGFFDGNALLAQWNLDGNNTRRRLDDFLNYKSTKEFIDEIAKSHVRNIAKGDIQIVTRQKGRMTISGRTSDKVWMHPFLFIDFAMWINPTFKVTVIKFVYDELIKFRNDAGDAYREMSAAVAKITPKKEIPVAISKIAQGLNYICFGEHEKEIRNRQGEDKMKELVKLEQEITLLINVGHLRSFQDLHAYLQNKWRNKYQPAVFAFNAKN
jgi:hypothetical protein